MTSWKNLSNPLTIIKVEKQVQQVYGDSMIIKNQLYFYMLEMNNPNSGSNSV